MLVASVSGRTSSVARVFIVTFSVFLLNSRPFIFRSIFYLLWVFTWNIIPFSSACMYVRMRIYFVSFWISVFYLLNLLLTPVPCTASAFALCCLLLLAVGFSLSFYLCITLGFFAVPLDVAYVCIATVKVFKYGAILSSGWQTVIQTFDIHFYPTCTYAER